MNIGIPAETHSGEKRIAATPETVKKLTANGHHKILVQSGAGVAASIPDSQFAASGASIVGSPAEMYAQSEILLKVRGPEGPELAMMRKDAILIGLLAPQQASQIAAYAKHGLTAFAM